MSTAPQSLTTNSWTVNNDPDGGSATFEKQTSHADWDPSNHVYIYKAVIGTYTDPSFTIVFKNDSTHGLGWYDHGSGQPGDAYSTDVPASGLGNGNTLGIYWDKAWGNGQPNWFVNNDNFFKNYSIGPTVTTGRSTHSGIIPNTSDHTIRNPSPGSFYEKTGAGKFKFKFYDQNEPSGGYNITIDWTSLNNTAASHTETISAASGDYSIEIDTLTNGVKHNSNITVKFNQPTYYNGQFYAANSILKQVTYIANGPFSGSFTPSSGDPVNNTLTVTVLIEDDNPYPEGSRVLSYEKTDGTKTNVTLNSSNSWSFTTTFVASEGTAKIYDTDKDNATNANIVAQASYVEQTDNNNSGRPRDGYPIIMTNLFNRNRSIYSIGMTHKTAYDPFI